MRLGEEMRFQRVVGKWRKSLITDKGRTAEFSRPLLNFTIAESRFRHWKHKQLHHYAAHIKTSLDAAAINVMRPRKNKKGKKAIQNSQASPQPPDEETNV